MGVSPMYRSRSLSSAAISVSCRCQQAHQAIGEGLKCEESRTRPSCLLTIPDRFVILQNRCILSAAAYQPRGDRDDDLLETVRAELRVAPMPDAILVLDLPVEVALERIARERAPDAMERPDRLAGARERYRRLCELLPACPPD
jgi:thymidylate kinase